MGSVAGDAALMDEFHYVLGQGAARVTQRCFTTVQTTLIKQTVAMWPSFSAVAGQSLENLS